VEKVGNKNLLEAINISRFDLSYWVWMDGV